MSKGRRKQFYERSDSRRNREEKQYKKELLDANMGVVENETALSELQRSTETIDVSETGWLPENKRKWYVFDTNLILSCVDVLYDPEDDDWRPPKDFRPNLNNAHIIIPMKVYEELDHMKNGHSVNRSIAKEAFRRLERIFPNSERTMEDIMTLAQPLPTKWKQQSISLLPLHRDFEDSLPWVPRDDDNDGWIAVTALAATMIRDGLPVDGSVSVEEVLERSNSRKDVILLTNDKALRSKADCFAVRTKSYSFQPKPQYTGIRELTVPSEMFNQFYYEEKLSQEDFYKFLPDEAPLVANEYVVMTPENDEYPRGYFPANVPFANMARYHKGNGMLYPMRFMKYEGFTAPNAGIAAYYDAMNDDKIKVIVATGKAGTGKTFQIVRHAIKALKEGQFSQVVLIVSSDNGVGFLPGSQKRKLEPMVEFCKDAIRSYLAQTPEFTKKRELLRRFGDIDEIPPEDKDDDYRSKKSRRTERIEKPSPGGRKTYHELLEEQTEYIYDRYFTAIPYKQAQGRTFEDTIIIIDEAQRIVIDEMETFITRLGRDSLLVVCGDVNQIKFNSPEKRIKNGLIFTRKIYYNWEGCANIHLTDNMRHEAADIANQNYEKIIKELGELQTQ